MMKKYFITGLVTLLPLAITVWAVRFLLNLLTRPFMGIVNNLSRHLPPESRYIIHAVSQVLVLFIMLALLWIIGFIARRWFFEGLIHLWDKIVAKIPFVNKIYYISKEITHGLFGGKEKIFSQVVLLPFPNTHCYCLGLIAKEAPHACAQKEDGDLISIFIPTTPNPTTGFLVMTAKKDLIYLKMKPDEAIKYVVSCGVIQPGAAH